MGGETDHSRRHEVEPMPSIFAKRGREEGKNNGSSVLEKKEPRETMRKTYVSRKGKKNCSGRRNQATTQTVIKGKSGGPRQQESLLISKIDICWDPWGGFLVIGSQNDHLKEREVGKSWRWERKAALL